MLFCPPSFFVESGLQIGTAVGDADANNLTTYTHGGLASGVNASGRALIGIAGRASVVRSIFSVSVGGQAASWAANNDFGTSYTAFYLGPVGASGDVVVTWSGAMTRSGAVCWPLNNLLSTTPTDIDQNGGAAMSFSLDVAAGGAGFAIILAGSLSSWTGLTERYDAQFASEGYYLSGASLAFDAAQTGLAISTTATGGDSVGVAASFR